LIASLPSSLGAELPIRWHKKMIMTPDTLGALQAV
jgi:hypothetical protein